MVDFQANNTEYFRQVINDDALTPYQKYIVDWDNFNPNHLSGNKNRISQSFDALNRIRKAQYPQDLDGQRKEMIPKYNKGGALLALKVDSTDYVKEVAYNARGQRILIAMGNNIMTRYAYDPETFRVLRQRSALYKHSGHTYTPDKGIRQDLQYTYDLEGTITTINDAAPANTYAQGPGNLLREFNHDPLRRLLYATGREISNVYQQPSWDLNIRPMDYTDTNTYTRTYAYDKLGNIQKLKHKAAGHANQDFNRDYVYGTGDNRLQGFSVKSNFFDNLYDENGNLTREGQSRHYEWNANDKMAVFKNQAGSSTPSVYTNYFYNAQGERVKKHTRKGNKLIVTFYMDGGMFETSYVKPTGGSIDNNRFYNTIKISDDGATIATIRVGKNVDDNTFAIKYIVGDHLNNSTAVLKTTGTLINREEYYPFGETSFGGFQYKRYRYNGKEKDEESGLYEYGQRYYAPWICRFVSVDPVAEDYPHLSSYNYASNRPVTSVDAEGLQTPDEPKAQKNEGKSTRKNVKENEVTGANSKMPDNINVHNAPERTQYEGKYDRDYGVATEGLAGTAYDPSNPNPGSVRTHNPNYTKEVFWNPNFKTSSGKGAYFYQKTKVEPRIELQKIQSNEITYKTKQIATLQVPKKVPKIAIPEPKPLMLNTNIIVSIEHYTDGTLLLNSKGRSTDLDNLLHRIQSIRSQVSSITINAQVGTGASPGIEMTYSQKLFRNVSRYISQQFPEIQINIGLIGPASGDNRISDSSPLSIRLNPTH